MKDSNQNDKKQASMAVRRESSDFGPSAGLIGSDVDIQVATAKRYPRSIGKAKERAIEMATLDQETAAACIYPKTRAGKIIEGPSARLAEIIATSWGNLRVAAKTVGEDDKFSYAQAVGWDLETNVAISYETKRRITNRDGKRFGDDMIMTTANAAISIAFRNVVFRVIPRAYVNEIYGAARKAAAGSSKTLKQQRTEMIKYFQDQGVAEQRILDLLSIAKIDDITLDHLATLRGIATSIKSGVTSVKAFFSRHNERPNAVPVPDRKQEEEKDIASDKNRLLTQIRDEINSRWPGDSKENKKLKQEEVHLVFGCDTWKEVTTLTNDILGAGLRVLRDRAGGGDFFRGDDEGPAAGDDIPF